MLTKILRMLLENRTWGIPFIWRKLNLRIQRCKHIKYIFNIDADTCNIWIILEHGFNLLLRSITSFAYFLGHSRSFTASSWAASALRITYLSSSGPSSANYQPLWTSATCVGFLRMKSIDTHNCWFLLQPGLLYQYYTDIASTFIVDLHILSCLERNNGMYPLLLCGQSHLHPLADRDSF